MGVQMTGLPHQNYDALTEISTRTYCGKYVYSLQRVHALTEMSTTYSLKSKKGAMQTNFA